MSTLCYNKACGKHFEPENNSDNACTFHPGVPVFHDALKGWSCCESKTTDFSEFLSIAGCTKGPHNNEKPPEPVKPDVTLQDKKDDKKCYEYIVSAPKPLVISRPRGDEPMVRLQHKISPSLKQALEKLKLSENTIQKKEEDSSEIKIGTSCGNGGCTKSFEGQGNNDEMCSYHVGFPVFHEGMKYWSCCKSKTSDFNTFLSQEGCKTGTHQWRKKDTGKKEVPCRFDWHQTGSQVTISIYAKNSNPDLSYVEANGVTLNIHVIFEGEKEFKKNINLWGVIDVGKSVVNMMAAKMEIVMKKSEPVSWGDLHLPPRVSPPKEDNEKDKEEADD